MCFCNALRCPQSIVTVKVERKFLGKVEEQTVPFRIQFRDGEARFFKRVETLPSELRICALFFRDLAQQLTS